MPKKKTNRKGNRRPAPFFSVIMPLYNKISYLPRSMGSVLGQTFKDLELIVIDDGSTDGGDGIARSMRDPRVQVIVQKNAGVSVARNRGVTAARGRFIAFLDADDEWDPDHLEALVGLIRDYPEAGLFATNYRVNDGKGPRENQVPLAPGWKGKMRDFYHLMNEEWAPLHTSSVCLPAALAKKTPFPPGIKAGEDIYVWFRTCLDHEMAYLNRPLSTWYLQTAHNAHRRFFGPAYHLDWLALEKEWKKEIGLSANAQRFMTLLALAQVRKMILHGYRRQALAQLGRCPRTHYPLKQAGLLFLALSPQGFYETYRDLFHFFNRVSTRRLEGVQTRDQRPPASSGLRGSSPGRAPYFSVVIPLYNKKGYIRRSVSSVLGQTFQDLELIVVDDGSSDGSPAIVRSLKDKRIRLIVQKNAGVSAARNRGVTAARGRFVAFLDADDDWDSGYLEALRDLTKDFPDAGLYGTNYWIEDGSGRRVNKVALPMGWRGRRRHYYDLTYYGRPPFCTNTICLPAWLAKEIPFPLGIKAGEDLYVWFKASLKYDMAYLNQPLSTYYVEANENTHKAYFGPKYHFDWLDLGQQFKKEGLLPRGGEKYVIWATLIQVRKMIANGFRREAWSKWLRCPKTYFPLYQAALFVMFLLPSRTRNASKSVEKTPAEKTAGSPEN